MELKNLNAIIELLGPQEFGEFKDEIRRQLQEETEGDLAQKEKEIKAYRTTLVNFARHALQILIHYDIPLDKLEKKIESLTPAPTPASEYPLSVIHPAPASTSTPIEIPPGD